MPVRSPALLVLTLLTIVASRDLAAQKVKLVANAATDVSEMSSATAARIFLKQEKKLGAGAAAAPVDQVKTSAPRAAFSSEILGRSVSAIETYWQQQVFSGKDAPPDAKATDDDVLAFVKATPGAIGYVSATAAIPAGVKVITIK
jgi:ABC-type phosphate transport system substrate-binding protein